MLNWPLYDMNFVRQSHITIYRARNPNSNLPLSPTHHIPHNMERNPAYGQLNLSVDSSSTDYPRQSNGLAGAEYDNTAGTIASYAYIIP